MELPLYIQAFIDKHPKIATLVARLSKFSVIGLVMTLLTFSANTICLKIYKTPLIPTYVTIYATSIFLSYALNSYFTFKSKMTLLKAAGYYVIYLSSMGLGVLVLKFYQWALPFENLVLYVLSIPVTTVWNFTLSSKWMKEAIQK